MLSILGLDRVGLVVDNARLLGVHRRLVDFRVISPECLLVVNVRLV
jgi:hypothetical protein